MDRLPDTLLLAIDTSGAACSVALWRSGAIRSHRFRSMRRGHAEALMPMVQETLHDAGAAFEAVTAIGVTVGPGSFTGVRAGLAAARGFALARDLPLIGVDSFEAIARAVPEADRAGRALVVAIDTRRRDLYLQAFGASSRSPLGPGVAASPEAALDMMPEGPLIVAGDGRHMLLPLLRDWRDVVEAALDSPDARDVAVIAACRLRRETGSRAAVPLYLREPEAVVPKWGGRLRP